MAERSALVTGGGSGIGRAITFALVDSGHHVTITGRREDALRETAAASSAPDRVHVARGDVAESADVASMFAGLERLDLLVNNAGIFASATPIEDVTEQEWQSVFAVNVTGAFLCTQQAVRLMKRQQPGGGRIVNIGSVSAQRPRRDSVAYAVSKHALTGLTRATALDGREFGITCSQLDIGNAATDMAVSAATHEATFDAAHIGAMVATLAAMPTDVTVLDMTMFATGMPLLDRA